MSGPIKISTIATAAPANALAGTEKIPGYQISSISNLYGGTVGILVSQIGTYVRGLFTTTPATIAEGGTGAATATAARTNLGVGNFVPVTGVSGADTIVGTIPTANSSYVTNGTYILIPAVTNTTTTTVNFTPLSGAALGAKNVFSGGAACVGGELVAGVPVALVYDGTQMNILGSDLNGSTATTFTFNGSGGTSGSITIPWTKNGKWARLNLPPTVATSGTGSVVLQSNTALPAGIRPTTSQVQPHNGLVINAAGISSSGVVAILTNGIIQIARDNLNTAWTNTTANSGTNTYTTVDYYLG